MRKPRKVAIHKARGEGKLRTSGIARFFEKSFMPKTKLFPALNAIKHKENA